MGLVFRWRQLVWEMDWEWTVWLGWEWTVWLGYRETRIVIRKRGWRHGGVNVNIRSCYQRVGCNVKAWIWHLSLVCFFFFFFFFWWWMMGIAWRVDRTKNVGMIVDKLSRRWEWTTWSDSSCSEKKFERWLNEKGEREKESGRGTKFGWWRWNE